MHIQEHYFILIRVVMKIYIIFIHSFFLSRNNGNILYSFGANFYETNTFSPNSKLLHKSFYTYYYILSHIFNVEKLCLYLIMYQLLDTYDCNIIYLFCFLILYRCVLLLVIFTKCFLSPWYVMKHIVAQNASITECVMKHVNFIWQDGLTLRNFFFIKSNSS